MEEVLLIADMQLWPDVLQISFNHTVGSKYLLNKKYLLSPVLSTDRLNTLGWILSLTSTVRSRIWMSLLLLLSLAVPGFCCQHKTRTYVQESGEESGLLFGLVISRQADLGSVDMVW